MTIAAGQSKESQGTCQLSDRRRHASQSRWPLPATLFFIQVQVPGDNSHVGDAQQMVKPFAVDILVVQVLRKIFCSNAAAPTEQTGQAVTADSSQGGTVAELRVALGCYFRVHFSDVRLLFLCSAHACRSVARISRCATGSGPAWPEARSARKPQHAPCHAAAAPGVRSDSPWHRANPVRPVPAWCLSKGDPTALSGPPSPSPPAAPFQL